MPEAQRTLSEVQSAAAGLEEAIVSLGEISQHPQAPYPKHDIEQRANMARNTMRKQLERATQAQKEYEERNFEKLQAAKQKREEELKRREDAKKAAAQAELDRKLKIAAERMKIAEKDRELADLRAEEDRAREAAELTTDSETGDKVKRKKKPRGGGGKRKKKNDDGITDDESGGEREPKQRRRAKRGSGDDSEEEKPKKKRRLAKKGATEKPNKFKSSEIVVESDSDGDNGAADAAKEMDDDVLSDAPAAMDVDEDEATPAPIKRKNRRAMIDSDDEDEDDEAPAPREDSPGTANGDTPMADPAPAAEDSDDE
jgi:RNA polymerase-associated protein CTR9